jgi:hypothetical protein
MYADVYTLISHERKCLVLPPGPQSHQRAPQPMEFRITLNGIDDASVLFVTRFSANQPVQEQRKKRHGALLDC